MTPKEKAQGLIGRYLNFEIEVGGEHDGYICMKKHEAKECALIAADEIIKEIEKKTLKGIKHPIALYWIDVKTEIEKL